MTWHKWQIQLGNSLRVMVTKPTDQYGSLYQVAALGWTWTGLPWLPLIPVKDVPRMWIVNIWLRETHLHSLSLWTWKFFFSIEQRDKTVHTHQHLSPDSASQPLSTCSRPPICRPPIPIMYLSIYTFYFVLFNVFTPRQYSGHLSVFSSSSDIPFLFHLGKSCVFSCILCLLVIS